MSSTNEWKTYRKKTLIEAREVLEQEEVPTNLRTKGPQILHAIPGDFVARDPLNREDQWVLTKKYMEVNYEPA